MRKSGPPLHRNNRADRETGEKAFRRRLEELERPKIWKNRENSKRGSIFVQGNGHRADLARRVVHFLSLPMYPVSSAIAYRSAL